MSNPPFHAVVGKIRQLLQDRRCQAYLKNFFGALPPEFNGRRILQYVGIGSMYLTPTEILLYHSLRERGFAVDYLIYDDSIPINEIITEHVEITRSGKRFWKKNLRNARRMLDAAGVQYQYITSNPEAEAIANGMGSLESVLSYQYDGIDFGAIAEGSLYRYYKSRTFGDNALHVARRVLRTALSSYFCVRAYAARHRYEFALFSHGIYMTWQPVVEYCRRNGLSFVCYDRAKTKDTANFNVNQPSPDWSFEAAWQRYTDHELTEAESAQVRQRLQDRELQAGDVYAYNFSGRANDVGEEKRRLGIPAGRKVVTIFTNLIWDAANVCRDIAFSDALECVKQTIQHFAAVPDVHVVVRAHPAEKVLGTQERYASLVRDHFGNGLPTNLTLISPEDNVNSFTVIDMTDVGVVNTSTVGLEMAVLGKPVVLISETHYRGKGFTHDVTTSKEYFQTLHRLLADAKPLPAQSKLAEKYFYMMMFLYQQKLPSRYVNGRFDGYCCERFADLDDSEPLVRIVNRLAEGMPEDFIEWPETSFVAS